MTSNQVLEVINGVLAAAAVATAVANALTIRSSNRVAKASEDQARTSALTIQSSNRVAQASEEQARATKDEVQAALAQLPLLREQLDIAAKQLEHSAESVVATIRPLLVDIPAGLYIENTVRGRLDAGEITLFQRKHDNAVVVQLGLRNIGPGPAFIHQARFIMGSYGWEMTVNRHVVPNAERVTLALVVPPDDMGYASLVVSLAKAGLSASVTYNDLAGGQRRMTWIDLARDTPQSMPYVLRVRLYECDDEWLRASEPIVVSGPDMPLR